MAERPDPKDIRVSMVDKGWSESPPNVAPDVPPPPPLPGEPQLPPPPPLPKSGGSARREAITRDEAPEITEIDDSEPRTETLPRVLPPYEESERDPVTRVDDLMQARAEAMAAAPDDPQTARTVVAPALPVPPVSKPVETPAIPVSTPVETPAAPMSKPVETPVVRSAAKLPPPSARPPRPLVPMPSPSRPSAPPAAPAPPLSRSSLTASSSPFGAERPAPPPLPRTFVAPVAKPAPRDEAPPAVPAAIETAEAPPLKPEPGPPPLPPAAATPAALIPSAETASRRPDVPAAKPEPALTPKVKTAAWPIGVPPIEPAAPVSSSTVPALDAPFGASSTTMVDQYGPVSTLRDALIGRVRVANRPVPLWLVLVPVFVLTAMFAALVVGLLGSKPTATAAAPAPSGAPDRADPSSVSGPNEKRGATTPLERAESGDAAALATLEQKKPRELGTDEVLAIARGKVARDVSAAEALRGRLARDPGLAKDKKIVTDLLRFAHGRQTSHTALAAMAALPGPLSADLLYEVWTGTAERSDATELARALLLGKDVRPKASPALSVALELREATTCEESKALLSKAIEQGDKRALVPINRLARRTGCGPNKRQDCHPCLRDGDLIKRAFNSVRERREPGLFSR